MRHETLALAAVLVLGLGSSLRAQPSHPRVGVWNGTNAQGLILHVEEDNSDLGRGPVLRGWICDHYGVHRLLSPVFHYSNNTFRADFMARGQTNRLEIVYKEGNETNGTARAVWGGKEVIFHSKP